MFPLAEGGKGQDREVFIDIKHGVETKNYDSVSGFSDEIFTFLMIK